MKYFWVIFLIFGFSFFAVEGQSASSAQSNQWPNDPFYLPVGSTFVGPVDFARASKVQSQLQSIYAGEFNFFGQPNRILNITLDWAKPYFGAFSTLLPVENSAGQFNAFATVWGGYVRVPEMTDAALALTLCHELGHHFGGEPRQQSPLPDWSSSEGQSDYYAATICFPRWLQLATDQQKPKLFHPDIVKKCGLSQSCLMVAQAGFEFVKVIHRYSYQNLPALSVMVGDSTKAPVTLTNVYPSYQCRLDTFLQVAEGNKSNKIAVRPACWFKE